MQVFLANSLKACLLLVISPLMSTPLVAYQTGNHEKALRNAFEQAYQNVAPPASSVLTSPLNTIPRTARVPGSTFGKQELPPGRSTTNVNSVRPAPYDDVSLHPRDDLEPTNNENHGEFNPLTTRDVAISSTGIGRHSFDQEPSRTELNQPQSMWWHGMVVGQLEQRDAREVNGEMLIQLALRNSPAILAISKQPLIQETEISEALAEFDAELFVRTQFDDRVDPVGNDLELTLTGQPFLKDHIWYADGGFKKKLNRGGELELRQRVGFQNSNSRFFNPQDQGTATLSLNFTQPLMRGRGEFYNRSQIMMARIGHDASWDQYASGLQDELTAVVEAYWKLYYSRAVLLQKQYNVERGDIVLKKLIGRSGLDSLPSQIARARSAVQSRQTELANARRDVRNAETEIRRLIGSQENFQVIVPELIPTEPPTVIHSNQDPAVVIQNAIQMRPEVKQTLKRARLAAIQKDVSQQELMPELNLIFNTYVSALRGESDVVGSWSDQFTNSTPGYAVGFEYNMPRWRRAERARITRQQLVLEQVRNEIDQTVNEVVAEAQIAWRRVDSAYQTVLAATEAISAARSDLLQNEARWESFALVEGDLAEGQTPTTLLDQLLDAQQRLANAELTYSQAILEYKSAEIGLKRASGTLLTHRRVSSATDSP